MKIICFVSLFFTLLLQGQSYTVTGTVKDKLSGENLIGANIFDQVTGKGTITNQFGYFSYTTPNPTADLSISYVGFETTNIKVQIAQNSKLNIELEPKSINEVVVTAKKNTKFQETTQMSSIEVPIKQIKQLPALLGETDVLKILQLLPGVQSGTEGTSGLYVRGGGADQNLILLDGVPIYNATHLFGFFSIFNADAINTVELIKGGFPARYGGRLSSVIDINLKEGNKNKIKGEGSIGLISSKITLEGPIKSGKTSFIFSARRTYIDLLIRPFMSKNNNGSSVGYYFYDLNTKISHQINDQNKLYVSLYNGLDKAYGKYKDKYTSEEEMTEYNGEFGLKWGNTIAAIRWNRILSPKIFVNNTFTYSRYHFDIFEEYSQKSANTEEEYSTKYVSGITDWALRSDWEYIPNPNHYIRFGTNIIQHKFTPGAYTQKETNVNDIKMGPDPLSSVEYNSYLEDDWLLSNNFKTNIGLHFSGFSENHKSYTSLQPRISTRYLISKKLSVKASFVNMTQYLHLLTNSGIGLPTDLWVPATSKIAPQKSSQIAFGIAQNYKSFEISIETYIKKMKGLIEYKEGASYINLDKDWQNKVVIGQGESWGAELLIQKKTGNTTGWLGYTYSKSFRTFPDINYGKTFPYKYDRRHDISLTLSQKIKKQNNISLVWVYGTGNAVSLPTSTYEAIENQNSVSNYEGRNSFRYNSYHRLDLSYTTTKTKKWGERSWIFSIYNVYNRKNPFFMAPSYDYSGNSKIVQYSLFPIIPSISYSFKF